VLPDIGGDGLPDLFVSAPIKDENNNLVGVLILDVPIQRLLTETMELTYVGKTGETLVVSEINNQLIHLHPVRFDDGISTGDAMHIDDDAAGLALKSLFGIDGTGIKIDYRNEEVLASWRYLPSLDWGLVTKIDVSEAFPQFNN
jgi:hypothetical protein